MTNKDFYSKKGEISIRVHEDPKHPSRLPTYEFLFHRIKRIDQKHRYSYIDKDGVKHTQQGKTVKLNPKVIYTFKAENEEQAKQMANEFLEKECRL